MINATMRAGVPLIWDAGEMIGASLVVAHQGGWDEALLVLSPVALFGLLLRAAVARSDHERPTGDERGPA